MRDGVARCLLTRPDSCAPAPCLDGVYMGGDCCKTNEPERNSHASTPDPQLFNGVCYVYLVNHTIRGLMEIYARIDKMQNSPVPFFTLSTLFSYHAVT